MASSLFSSRTISAHLMSFGFSPLFFNKDNFFWQNLEFCFAIGIFYMHMNGLVFTRIKVESQSKNS